MLTVTIEDDQGRKTDVPVSNQGLTIGRAKENQLRLNERNISRKHARLSLESEGLIIEDLDSYNGIRINGDRISGRCSIYLGDRIQVGDFFLQVHGELLKPRPEEVTQKTLIPKKQGSDEVTNTEPMVVAPVNPTAPGATPELKPPGPPPPPQGDDDEDDHSFEENTALIRMTEVGAQKPTGPATLLSGPSPKLFCVKGPMAGREWTVTKTEMVIGRGQENDVCIDHRSMSRAHAKLVMSGQTFRIIDMGSANKTLVNGEEYAQVDLKRGDVIELGHVRLRLVWPGEPTPAIETGPDTAFEESTEVGRPRRAEGEAAPPMLTRTMSSPLANSRTLIIAGSVGVAVAVVAVVLVMAFSDEAPKPPQQAPPAQRIVIADSDPTPAPPAAGAKTANSADVLQRANAEMANENWDQAVKILELGLDADNGNAELKAALDHADAERTAKMTFEAANSSMQRGDYVTARELFQQVPEDSVYYPRAQKKLSDSKIKNARATGTKIAMVSPKAGKEATDKPVDKPADKPADKPVDKAAATPSKTDKPAPAPTKAEKTDKAAKGDKTAAAPPAAEEAPPAGSVSPREQAKKLFEQGNKALMQNRIKEAIEYYVEATRVDPKFAPPHRSLGIAHARAGNGDAAVEHYRQYLKLYPTAPDAEAVKKIVKEYESGD